MSNRRLVVVAEGRVAAASVGAGYAAIQSNLSRVINITFANSLNGDVSISFDGGTTTYITLPAGQTLSVDLGANHAEYSGTISIKQGPSGASTTGFISCGVIKVN